MPALLPASLECRHRLKVTRGGEHARLHRRPARRSRRAADDLSRTARGVRRAGLGGYPLADPPADVRARAHRRGRVGAGHETAVPSLGARVRSLAGGRASLRPCGLGHERREHDPRRRHRLDRGRGVAGRELLRAGPEAARGGCTPERRRPRHGRALVATAYDRRAQIDRSRRTTRRSERWRSWRRVFASSMPTPT